MFVCMDTCMRARARARARVCVCVCVCVCIKVKHETLFLTPFSPPCMEFRFMASVLEIF